LLLVNEEKYRFAPIIFIIIIVLIDFNFKVNFIYFKQNLSMNIFKSNYLLIFLSLIFLSSCSSKKEVLYFNDIDANNQDKNLFTAGKIQSNDILSIIISSSSSDLAVMYNLNQDQKQNTLTFPGYLVNLDGKITLPILGKLYVKGVTISELEELVVKKLIEGKHLDQPVVTARLMNAKFTVLGEVNRPGTYNYSEQNLSILQALGYAGDLTINGKRQNVLLIREENNAKSYITIDMTTKNWFGSPYYYIKPNDVIYINPNGPKVKSAGYIGNLGTFISVISVTLSLALSIILLTK
jgi:polysaccharide export outer membrane protein